MKHLMGWLGIFFVFTSCYHNVAKNYTIIKQETYGGTDKEENRLITSQQGLLFLYNELNAGTPPTVDFDKYSVVALFMGQKNSGGYSIRVNEVKVKNNTGLISVVRTVPDGVATMALTAPYCILILPKVNTIEVK